MRGRGARMPGSAFGVRLKTMKHAPRSISRLVASVAGIIVVVVVVVVLIVTRRQGTIQGRSVADVQAQIAARPGALDGQTVAVHGVLVHLPDACGSGPGSIGQPAPIIKCYSGYLLLPDGSPSWLPPVHSNTNVPSYVWTELRLQVRGPQGWIRPMRRPVSPIQPLLDLIRPIPVLGTAFGESHLYHVEILHSEYCFEQSGSRVQLGATPCQVGYVLDPDS